MFGHGLFSPFGWGHGGFMKWGMPFGMGLGLGMLGALPSLSMMSPWGYFGYPGWNSYGYSGWGYPAWGYGSFGGFGYPWFW